MDVSRARVLATGIDGAWRVMPRSRGRAHAHRTSVPPPALLDTSLQPLLYYHTAYAIMIRQTSPAGFTEFIVELL